MTLAFSLALPSQFLLASDEFQMTWNETALTRHAERSFVFNDDDTPLEKLLKWQNTVIDQKIEFKNDYERNNNWRKFGWSLSGGIPFAGAAIQDRGISFTVDEDMPQERVDDYLKIHLVRRKALLFSHREQLPKIFDLSKNMLQGSQESSNELLAEGIKSVHGYASDIDEKQKRLEGMYEKFREQSQQDRITTGYQIRELETEIRKDIYAASDLAGLIGIADVVLADPDLSEQDKTDFSQAIVDLEKAKKTGDTQIMRESSETIITVQTKRNEIKAKKTLEAATNTQRTVEKLNKPKVSVAGFDFTGAYDHDLNPEFSNFVDTLAITHATASILNSVASISNDADFKKTTNDFMVITTNVAAIASSVAVLTSATAKVPAMAAASATGVGAVIAIISIIAISSKKKNDGLKKMFESLFKQLDHIIEMLQHSLKNQQKLLVNQSFMISQNERIISMLNFVQRQVHNITEQNQYTHQEIMTAFDRLSALNYDLSVKNQASVINDKINESINKYVDPLLSIADRTNDLTNAIFYNLTNDDIELMNAGDVEGNDYLQELADDKSTLITSLAMESQKIGKFLTLNRQEGASFGVGHSRGENIFSSSRFTINQLISELNVDTNYQPPTDNEYIENEYFQNFYSYDSQLITHDLDRFYQWLISNSRLDVDSDTNKMIFNYEKTSSSDQVTSTGQFLINSHQVNNNVSEILLFDISETFFNTMSSFYRYSKSIPKNIVELIKKRLNKVKTIKDNYRATLPMVLNQYKNTLSKIDSKLRINTAPDNNNIYPLAKLINELEEDLKVVNEKLNNNTEKTVYDYNHRYSRLQNSKNKYEPEPHNKDKTVEYQFVQIKKQFFEVVEKASYKDLDPKDIRSQDGVIPNANSNIPERTKIIQDMKNFIDTNSLGNLIEGLAAKYGLITVNDLYKDSYEFDDFVTENYQPYLWNYLYHSSTFTNNKHDNPLMPKSYNIYWMTSPTKNMKYSSKYEILKTDALSLVDLNSDYLREVLHSEYPALNETLFDYQKFGDKRNTSLFNRDGLLYTGYIRGRYAFNNHNYQAINLLNGNIYQSLYLIQKTNKKIKLKYYKTWSTSHLLNLFINPILKDVNPGEDFDKLYADNIETSIGYLKNSLSGLLKLLKHDLVYIYELAASSPNMDIDSNNLKLKSYYEENGIDIQAMFADIKNDLELAKHYRYALYKMTDYAYKGCEDKIEGIAHLYQLNRINQYDSSDVNPEDIENYFAAGESFNNAKLGKYYNVIKDLNINFGHIAFPIRNTLSLLTSEEQLVSAYEKAQNLNCGQVTYYLEKQAEGPPKPLKTSASLLLKKIHFFESLAGIAISD